jgi:hypothetical protein
MGELDLEYKKLVYSKPFIVEAINIANLKSLNKNYWLIGGIVYRLLNELLHNTTPKGVLKKTMDVDILFEELDSDLVTGDYHLSYTSLGEPRLKKEDLQIDLIRLGNVSYITKNNLKPSLENYLNGTFTDVQNIAFSLLDNRLIGLGISAIKQREIRVTNMEELCYYCGIKGISVEDYLKKLSVSLDMPII